MTNRLVQMLRVNPWLRFNIAFWCLFVTPFVLMRLSALWPSASPFRSGMELLAELVIVPIAMVVVLAEAAYRARRVRRDMVAYIVLGLAPLVLMWLPWVFPSLEYSVGNSMSHLLPGRMGWASWFVPGAAAYGLAYVALLGTYWRIKTPKVLRPSLIGIVVALVVLVVTFTYTINVPAAAGKVLKEYFAARSDVVGYQVEDTRWTSVCCAVSALVPPNEANKVRYRVIVTFKDGKRETETIDFYDSRDEGEQFDDLNSGIGGHQKWRLRHVYRPGETVEPDVWTD